MTDYYKILNINKSATEKDIKKAYRKLALQLHPDKPTGNEEEFKKLSEAYSVLSDKKKKQIYDKYGKKGLDSNFNSGNGGHPGFRFTNHDAHNLYSQFFSFGRNMNDANMFNMGDFVHISTGSNGPRIFKTHRKLKDRPIYYTINCSLEELDYGTTKKIKITKKIHKSNSTIEEKTSNYNIDIKPGWKEGTKITYPNAGDEYENSHRVPSDIIFIIRQKNHTNFIRENNNIIKKLSITLKEALIGFDKIITTLRGEKLKIKSDKIIKFNQNNIINNKGFTIKNNQNDINNRGNFIIKYDIIFPDSLSDKQKEILKVL